MHILLRIALALLALTLCIATLIPLIRTNEWWVRAFDFPRVQIAVGMVVVLLVLAAVFLWSHRRTRTEPSTRTRHWRKAEVAVPILFLAALAWQLFRIYPYTPLGRSPDGGRDLRERRRPAGDRHRPPVDLQRSLRQPGRRRAARVHRRDRPRSHSTACTPSPRASSNRPTPTARTATSATPSW